MHADSEPVTMLIKYKGQNQYTGRAIYITMYRKTTIKSLQYINRTVESHTEKVVFFFRSNLTQASNGMLFTSAGSEFQTVGAKSVNKRGPKVFRLVFWILKSSQERIAENETTD